MLLEILKVHVPPYWGVPRLFHQFPVEVVLTDVVTTAVVVDVVEIGVLVVDVVVITGVVEVVDVVDVAVVDEEEHDANTIDITMRKAKSPQNVPLFIKPPFISVLRGQLEICRQVKSFQCSCKLQILFDKVGHPNNPDYSQGSITGGASCNT
jgi:hypothetical protein